LFCSRSAIGSIDPQSLTTPGPALRDTGYCFILDLIGFDFFGLVNEMADDGRVVTAKLPDDLVSRMDEIADRIDRSKSWIVRQAVTEWLAEEQRRHELTLEALKDVDEGRTIPHEEVLAMVEQRKRERREARARSAA
jgi:predicted transcriptional regulator